MKKRVISLVLALCMLVSISPVVFAEQGLLFHSEQPASTPIPAPTPHEVIENPFTDVADDAWYVAPVLWAKENNVTGGTSETTFGPGESCTRAQVVTFLYKVYGDY